MDKSKYDRCNCRRKDCHNRPKHCHEETPHDCKKKIKYCKGDTGPVGPPGPPGETFGAKIICVKYIGRAGNSIPRNSTGHSEGDYFLDTNDADLFELRTQAGELHWVKHKDDTVSYYFYDSYGKTMWHVEPVNSDTDVEHGDALRVEEFCDLLNIKSQLLDIGNNILYTPVEDEGGLLWCPEEKCSETERCSCVKILCLKFEGRSGNSTPISVLADDYYYLNHGTNSAHDANLYVVNGDVFQIEPEGAEGDYYYYSKNEKTIWFVEPETNTNSLEEGFVTRVEDKCKLKEGDVVIDGKTGRVFKLNADGEWILSECGLCQCKEYFRLIKLDCAGGTCDDIRECEITEAGQFVLSNNLIYTSVLVGESLQWVLDTTDCNYYHDTADGQIYSIVSGVATNIMLDELIGAPSCNDVLFDCEAKIFYQWNGTIWERICDFSDITVDVLNVTTIEGETGCFNLIQTDRVDTKTLPILTLGADTKVEGNFLVSTSPMTQVPPNVPGTYAFQYQNGASMSFRSGTVTATEWDSGIIGTNSTAVGFNTIADGSNSFAQGSGTVSQGTHSHAEGEETSALGFATHTSGKGTIAWGSYTKACGTYNCFGSTNGDIGALLVVGDGASDLSRTDAMWVNDSGDAFVKNNFYGGYLGFQISRFFSGTGGHDLYVGDGRTSYIAPYDMFLERVSITNVFGLNFTLRISYTDQDNIPRTFATVVAGAPSSCVDIGAFSKKGSFLGATIIVTTDPVVDASVAIYVVGRVTRGDLFRKYKL